MTLGIVCIKILWLFSLHRFCAFRQVEMNVRVALALLLMVSMAMAMKLRKPYKYRYDPERMNYQDNEVLLIK